MAGIAHACCGRCGFGRGWRIGDRSTISVPIDLCNPAEFFACCGLLEAASRIDEHVEAWFGAHQFNLRSNATCTPLDILAAVTTWEMSAPTDDSDDKAPSVIMSAPQPLRLDWWLDPTRRRAEGEAAATPFKLWAGQQSSISILEALLSDAKRCVTERDAAPMQRRVPLSGRFGFDPTAAWIALDVGWSPNEQGVEVGTRAVVELLAAIGLQRFRPAPVPSESFTYQYTAWATPLPTLAAAPMAAGAYPSTGGRTFRFRIVKRGSYKGFDRANHTETHA